MKRRFKRKEFEMDLFRREKNSQRLLLEKVSSELLIQMERVFAFLFLFHQKDLEGNALK